MRLAREDIRQAQELSLRSLVEVFGKMGTDFGDAVAADLKTQADLVKWAGIELENPFEQELA